VRSAALGGFGGLPMGGFGGGGGADFGEGFAGFDFGGE
jgi:hypothetical protein